MLEQYSRIHEKLYGLAAELLDFSPSTDSPAEGKLQ